VGRSHRSAGKAKLKDAIDRTKALLGMPQDYRLASCPPPTPARWRWRSGRCWVPATVDLFAWESFSEDWVTDTVSSCAFHHPPVQGAIWRTARSWPVSARP